MQIARIKRAPSLFGAIAVPLLAWLLAFHPVFESLFNTWIKDSNNSHGLLVPMITAYLIWSRRGDLRNTRLESALPGFGILIAGTIIHLVAYAGALEVLGRLMAVGTLLGLVLYVWGPDIFEKIRFPLFFLFFMVPVPDTIYSQLAFPLQLFASQAAALLIQATGIPVFREGNLLHFVQTRLEVVEICSGLRSMTAFLMLGVLFAYLLKNHWIVRLALCLSAIPLAMVANIVRVAGTGILAHFYGREAALGFLHQFSGMAVFAFGVIMMSLEYALMARLHRRFAGPPRKD